MQSFVYSRNKSTKICHIFGHKCEWAAKVKIQALFKQVRKINEIGAAFFNAYMSHKCIEVRWTKQAHENIIIMYIMKYSCSTTISAQFYYCIWLLYFFVLSSSSLLSCVVLNMQKKRPKKCWNFRVISNFLVFVLLSFL
jgi:hypothetical protein